MRSNNSFKVFHSHSNPLRLKSCSTEGISKIVLLIMKDPSGCCTPTRREGSERHKETGGIVTVSVASLPGNLLVMLISAYKPFITADEQLIRLPAPWPAALMHSECLSITRRHKRCPQGRLTVHHRFFVAVHFFTLASFNGNLEARYGTISSLYAI